MDSIQDKVSLKTLGAYYVIYTKSAISKMRSENKNLLSRFQNFQQIHSIFYYHPVYRNFVKDKNYLS